MLAWLDDKLERHARRKGHDGLGAALLLSPALLILGLFSAYPIFNAMRLSLLGGKYAMGGFTGLDNYRFALHNPAFWKSALVTFYYAAMVIPGSLALGFAAAWMLYRTARARALLRTAYFLPFITSVAAAAMVWRVLLQPQHGTANALLALAGLPAQQWLLEPRGVLHLLSGGVLPGDWGPSLSLCCVAAFDVWHSLGYVMAVFLAGLSAMPREIEEAARIDGAGRWRVMAHVTVPLLTPTIFFLLLVGGVRALQAFNSFYVLTLNGAQTLGTTTNLVMHLYANFYEYGEWGYGAAVAVLLSMAMAMLALAQWRLMRDRVFYQ